METVIKTEIYHQERELKTIIEIDNSTEYKDFTITQDGMNRPFELQLSNHENGKLLLEMGNTVLIDKEVLLLKEFLNQY